MAEVIQLGDPHLREKLRRLVPVNGFCLMADIVGSTELKEKDLTEWVIRMANTFNNIRTWVEPRFLKTVGDMLMFWFRDEDFYKSNTPLTLLDALAAMTRHAARETQYFQPVKVALCRCSHTFEMSFMRPDEDVYGKDIDLTARLLSLAEEGDVVMNHAFKEILSDHYNNCGNKEEFDCVTRIQGPWQQKIKGFAQPIPIYKLPATFHEEPR